MSDDGVNWDTGNEFVFREGGVADPDAVREYWHIGYPTVTQCEDGTVVAAYHQYSQAERPVQEMWVTRFRVRARET
jgi:hypothetical protein